MTRRIKVLPPVQYCKANGKVKYDKKGAATAKNQRRKQAHVYLRIYPCKDCGGWHLTSKYPLMKGWW